VTVPATYIPRELSTGTVELQLVTYYDMSVMYVHQIVQWHCIIYWCYITSNKQISDDYAVLYLWRVLHKVYSVAVLALAIRAFEDIL